MSPLFGTPYYRYYTFKRICTTIGISKHMLSNNIYWTILILSWKFNSWVSILVFGLFFTMWLVSVFSSDHSICKLLVVFSWQFISWFSICRLGIFLSSLSVIINVFSSDLSTCTLVTLSWNFNSCFYFCLFGSFFSSLSVSGFCSDLSNCLLLIILLKI